MVRPSIRDQAGSIISQIEVMMRGSPRGSTLASTPSAPTIWRRVRPSILSFTSFVWVTNSWLIGGDGNGQVIPCSK